MPSWNWDEVDSEAGVAHESVANTDHSDATSLVQGLDYTNLPLGVSWVAFWPLHEDSGTATNDITANNNDGSITGATLGQTGVLGSTAYDFDGTDDEVDSDNTIGLDNTTGGLSVVAVLNPDFDTTAAGDHYAVRVHAGGSNNLSLGYRDQWQFEWSSSNITWSDDTNRQNTWITVVMTADSADPVTGNIYIDGTLEQSGTFGAGETVNSTSLSWSLGYDLNTTSRYYDGKLCEVGVLDSELTSTQVTEFDDAIRAAGDWFSTTKTI